MSPRRNDPGVLILSRFAGASQECKAALLVNPYDPDSVAAAIGQALAMPLAERRERHNSLFRVLSRNDVQQWADSYVAALERKPKALMNCKKVYSVEKMLADHARPVRYELPTRVEPNAPIARPAAGGRRAVSMILPSASSIKPALARRAEFGAGL
jgi:trehalose 6-phosphate synthase